MREAMGFFYGFHARNDRLFFAFNSSYIAGGGFCWSGNLEGLVFLWVDSFLAFYNLADVPLCIAMVWHLAVHSSRKVNSFYVINLISSVTIAPLLLNRIV
jgi:hypothetical protein